MKLRRLLIPLLGAWIGIVIVLGVISIQAPSIAGRVIDHPHERAAKIFNALGSVTARQLVQYEAVELSLQQRDFWLRVEVGIGLFLFFGLLFGTDAGASAMALALAMLILVLAQLFGIYPYVMGLDRAMAFGGNEATLGRSAVFVRWVFLVTEAIKVLIGAGVVLLLGSRRRRKQFREEIHPVNNADHSHVDR